MITEPNVYEIVDYPIVVGTTTYTAKLIYCPINYSVGMDTMMVSYTLAGEDGSAYWSGIATITEAELDAWGTDNLYIVNLVCQQAGVQLV